MTVLDQQVGRADLIIRTDVDTEWGVQWTESADGGVTFAPVDLSQWSGTLKLRSALGETWLAKPVSLTVNGLAVAKLTSFDFGVGEWGSRTSGEWRIDVTSRTGRSIRLGHGYFYLEH